MKIGLFHLIAAFPTIAFAQTKCSFLPETEPIELALPDSVLTHPLKDLPIEFRGVSPIVTRKTLRNGEKPKVVIQKYSSEPSIFYDDVEGKVVVSASGCSDGNGSSGATSRSCWGMGAVAGAALLAGVTNGPTAAAGVAAAGLLQGAQAHSDSCEPVVQLVVEAPQSYVGAYDTCYNEINDPAICPDPFPEFATCDDPAPTCGLAVVGAGAGGLYAALRMVDEGKIDASEVCVFEMTERVGGRLFSLRGLGPDNDLTVDAGGYRTWPQFTPTAHALITEYLGIPMDCYDDSQTPCQVFNIVDEEGNKAGFTLFIEEMMRRLVDAGACWYPYHELTSFDKVTDDSNPNGEVTELKFANGVTATATFSTILNLPQRPLLNVVRNSDLDTKGLLDFETMDALHSVQTVIATKLYLYYPKGSVWWHQMGLEAGSFTYDGDARSMLLAGRYHDGQVRCDDDNDPSTCHGFLLAVYSNDLSGNKAQYFRRFQRERPEPITFITNKDLEGREFLRHAHERLIRFHMEEETESALSGFQMDQLFRAIQLPEFAVLSTWNTAIPWAGGAWHTWTDLSNIQVAKQPFVDRNIFVVNEAYSLLHGWAEGSLKVADEILEQYFDVERPWDFSVVDINQVVLQTSSAECVEASDGGSSGGSSGGDSGGSSGGGGGGGGGGIEDVLCFTGDALVSMADGTLKPIREVQEGDLVQTGTDKGAGRVTQALMHTVPDHKAVLTVMETEHGELVGTPDHPMYHPEADAWVDFENFAPADLLRNEEREVEMLYNLEIDADDVEGTSHSYVVNGMVASGLGDNEMLNLRFPRQEIYKLKAVAAATA